MADEKRPGAPGSDPDDDTYVLEDTGESLEDFDLAEVEAEVENVPSAAPAEAFDSSSEVSPVSGDPSAMRTENQKLKDQYLRSLADFENFRKRSEREKNDFFRYALSGVMKEILPVLDNFERALEHAPEEEFGKGVQLIYKQLFDTLTRNGLRTIDEANVPFDPNIHEGVMREETSSVPSHTVMSILQKGYFLNDRLIRPAMVKVAVSPSDSDGQTRD